jgi:GGDEF domain-containing protein/CHASE3 domain sensor protein
MGLSKFSKLIPASLLDKLVPKNLFSRLDLAGKMLAGYMVLVLLTIVVVAYALFSLYRLNTLNSSIVTVDVPIQEAADKMLEAIIAQDTYEKRYLILNSPDMKALFFKRSEEFQHWFDEINKLPNELSLRLEELAALHKGYMALFQNETALLTKGMRNEASRISSGPLKSQSEKIIGLLRELSASVNQARDNKMKNISFIGKSAFFMTAVLSLVSILLGTIASIAITHHISSSVGKLRDATGQIAEGNFSYDPQIKTKDEIGSLAASFVDMGKRLKKLEEMYLDASPLTRLPGGIAIENVLKKRIEAQQPMAFCLIDLDNFKSFNDRYGYAKGSELLKETGRIIEDVVKSRGSQDDFVGHIGGDDFVVITEPERMRSIGEEIIARFDKRIPGFYDPGDREKGYIMGRTRQGVEMKFPILTISIAIVTNERKSLTSALQASEIAAELKDYAKSIPKSVMVIDKRRTS